MTDLKWATNRGYKLSEDEKNSFCERIGMMTDSLRWEGNIDRVRVQAIKEILESRNE